MNPSYEDPTAKRWMTHALALAERGRGTSRPNPMVGAVLVKDGTVVGEDFHERAGQAHAEIGALRAAGEDARGADLYVTLEPCCYTGRTGPCTEALIEAGVRRAFVGAIDPNPRVAGQGLDRLREAGIEVTHGVLGDVCTELNVVFNHWVTTGRPLVVLKLASTLDGRIASRTGASQWITSEPARRVVHAMRAHLEAVMVGRGTALADDPRLTVRDAPCPGGQPIRVLVDSVLAVPVTARLFSQGDVPEVIVATALPSGDPRTEERRATGATVWSLPAADGRVDLAALIQRLGTHEPEPVTGLLVEGGAGLAAALVQADLVDRVHWFLAPTLMGADGHAAIGPLGVDTPDGAPRFRLLRTGLVGEDLEIVAIPARSSGGA